MQRLITLRGFVGTSRFNRVIDLCQLYNNSSSTNLNSNLSTLKRCLSNKNQNNIDSHSDLYKPSTAKKETHIPDELKGGQPTETIDSLPRTTATLPDSGKVWSAQDPASIHVAPLNAAATTHIPVSADREKTVHVTQGELHIADPSKTHRFQPDQTVAKLAEAAAASAFQSNPSNAPIRTPTDTTFAPKISSTDVHSTASSPTSSFATAAQSAIQDSTAYETTAKSQVFGGIDTSADTKTHPKEDPFDIKTSDKKSGSKDIPIQNENDLRDNILREALRFVDEHGWTIDAIRAGVRSSNQPSTIEGLFSSGYDLVEYFQRNANAKMAAYMKEQTTKSGKQGILLLIDGLKYRLGLVVPYANTWGQALAQGALPQNTIRSWKNLLDLSSEAWNAIGDTSTYTNWYTKRFTLATIYQSAEIYMLQDQSQGKIDTINFLERRLNDFQTFGSISNTVSKSLSDTAQMTSGIFSVIRNLTSRR